MLARVQMPDGWYPDPAGRHQHRRWEAGVWTDWVATNGQVGSEPLPPPPATGGGTLTTEPVIHATQTDGTWTLASPYGLTLATAVVEARVATVSDPSGRPIRQLRRSAAGSTSVISVVGLDNSEVGRFEEVRSPSANGFRVVGVGALLCTLEAQAATPTVMVLTDPGRRPLARITQDHDRWVTELAHPMGPPLGELAGLATLAIVLART